jgi:uncharacterized metal-binding protein (TIGR02443 family)
MHYYVTVAFDNEVSNDGARVNFFTHSNGIQYGSYKKLTLTPRTKKRFIAGAICPRCSEMDKLVMYKEDDKDFRECVSCGFHDEMRFKQNSRELDTRVNIAEEQVVEETQVLILDPNTPNKKH